jgi:hypothetical protein
MAKIVELEGQLERQIKVRLRVRVRDRTIRAGVNQIHREILGSAACTNDALLFSLPVSLSLSLSL